MKICKNIKSYIIFSTQERNTVKFNKLSVSYDKDELIEFDKEVIQQLDKDNRFNISFANSEKKISDSLQSKNNFVFYVLRENSTEQIIARCAINFHPTSKDICAYGEEAEMLFNTRKLVSFAGDLVHPKARGCDLQKNMIKQRSQILKECREFSVYDYDYVVAGIIEGNIASMKSYKDLGFQEVGRKIVNWVDGTSDNVILVGLDLSSLIN